MKQVRCEDGTVDEDLYKNGKKVQQCNELTAMTKKEYKDHSSNNTEANGYTPNIMIVLTDYGKGIKNIIYFYTNLLFLSKNDIWKILKYLNNKVLTDDPSEKNKKAPFLLAQSNSFTDIRGDNAAYGCIPICVDQTLSRVTGTALRCVPRYESRFQKTNTSTINSKQEEKINFNETLEDKTISKGVNLDDIATNMYVIRLNGNIDLFF